MKEVVLSALERLDLVDIEAIQQYLQERVDHALGGVFDIGGCASTPVLTITENDATNTYNIAFTAFEIIVAGYESGLSISGDPDASSNTTARVKKGYLARFDPSLANTYVPAGTGGTLSYRAYHDAVVTYHTANGSLPPAPSETNYVEATHGQYYPKIWARVRHIPASENRAFWSVAGEVEASQATTVRKDPVFEISLKDANVDPIADDEHPYVWIGQITKWGTPEGVAANLTPDGEVRMRTYTEAVLGVPAHQFTPNSQSFKYFSGLGATLFALKEKLDQLTNTGSDDPAGASDIVWNTPPKYSLSGLIDKVDELYDNPKTSFLIKWTINAAAGGVGSVRKATITPYPIDGFAVNIAIDHTKTLTGHGVNSVDFQADSPSLTSNQLALAADTVVLSFGNTLLGRRIRSCTFTPVATEDSNTWVNPNSTDPADHVGAWPFTKQLTILEDTPASTTSRTLSIITYKNASNTNVSVVGFRLKFPHLHEIQPVVNVDKTVTYRIDIEVSAS